MRAYVDWSFSVHFRDIVYSWPLRAARCMQSHMKCYTVSYNYTSLSLFLWHRMNEGRLVLRLGIVNIIIMCLIALLFGRVRLLWESLKMGMRWFIFTLRNELQLFWFAWPAYSELKLYKFLFQTFLRFHFYRLTSFFILSYMHSSRSWNTSCHILLITI